MFFGLHFFKGIVSRSTSTKETNTLFTLAKYFRYPIAVANSN